MDFLEGTVMEGTQAEGHCVPGRYLAGSHSCRPAPSSRVRIGANPSSAAPTPPREGARVIRRGPAA